MAHVDVARHQHRLYRLRQVHETQQVRHGAARAADGVRRLLMGKTEFRDQARDALRFFQRIEVFALDVLDQRHRGGVLVVDLAHQHRDLVQAGELRGTEAAFAGDDLVARAGRRRLDGTHEHRLHDALRLDRCRQFGQRTVVHPRARLVFAGLDLRDRQGGRHAGRSGRRFGRVAAEQCVETAAETLEFFGCHKRVPALITSS